MIDCVNLEERIGSHRGIVQKSRDLLNSDVLQWSSFTLLATGLPYYVLTCKENKQFDSEFALEATLGVVGSIGCFVAQKKVFDDPTLARVIGSLGLGLAGFGAGVAMYSQIGFHSLYMAGFFAAAGDQLFSASKNRSILEEINEARCNVCERSIVHEDGIFSGNPLFEGISNLEVGKYQQFQESIRMFLSAKNERAFALGPVFFFGEKYFERKWEKSKDITNAHNFLQSYCDNQDYRSALNLIESFVDDKMGKRLIQTTYMDRIYRQGLHRPKSIKVGKFIDLLTSDAASFVEERWRRTINNYLKDSNVVEIKGKKVLSFEDSILGQLFVGKLADDKESEFSLRLEDEFWDDPSVVISAPVARFEHEDNMYDLYQRISGSTIENESRLDVLEKVFDVSSRIFRMRYDAPIVDYADVAKKRIEDSGLRFDVDWGMLRTLIVEDYGIDKDFRGYNFLSNKIGKSRTIAIIDNLPKRKISSSYVAAKLVVETGSEHHQMGREVKLFYGKNHRDFEASHYAGIIISALGFLGFEKLNNCRDVKMQKRYCEAASYAARNLCMSDLSLSFDAHAQRL